MSIRDIRGPGFNPLNIGYAPEEPITPKSELLSPIAKVDSGMDRVQAAVANVASLCGFAIALLLAATILRATWTLFRYVWGL